MPGSPEPDTPISYRILLYGPPAGYSKEQFESDLSDYFKILGFETDMVNLHIQFFPEHQPVEKQLISGLRDAKISIFSLGKIDDAHKKITVWVGSQEDALKGYQANINSKLDARYRNHHINYKVVGSISDYMIYHGSKANVE